ncbi:acetylneuraminic acid synthetase [Leptospira yanagawae]|uniref:Acetylneuraminic acid synthetase n=1 Tax=Leptospira yanagawae TaxID=293069 RepID=A0ABY2LZX3_9LEPT|nr:N-acetylneuraminate synthase family protein [Leptospira yanagawae]TGL16972.1 acetylneuraminic acid synthetase [Leptospira yanagawae]
MKNIKLGKRIISQNSKPYIIAEIGVNHEGSIEKAKELIELAYQGGADAAKFQTYKAETLASKDSPAYWDTSKETTLSQYELFKKHDSFGEKEYTLLAEHCKKIGIDFLSTPFDLASVDFLDSLIPFYKIASADITSIPLLRKIAKKGKPVVLSTGSSNLWEIEKAINVLQDSGCTELALLHCILNYPCPDENANINMILGLEKAFPEYVIGYSDHTHPDEHMSSLLVSYLKGARILEKHFTHDKSLPGNDHYHAMDIDDLKSFNLILKKVMVLEGESEKKPIASEKLSRLNARRSIVANRNLKKGEVLEESALTFKRPAHGISPLYWDEVIGRKVNKDISEDHSIKWIDLEE